jgi:hypothetical protein
MKKFYALAIAAALCASLFSGAQIAHSQSLPAPVATAVTPSTGPSTVTTSQDGFGKAVVTTTTPSTSIVDLSPVTAPLIQLLGLVISGLVTTIGYFVINLIRSKLNMSKLEESAQIQQQVDAAAQKVIGGAISRLPAGIAVIDAHSSIAADAANAMVQHFAEVIKKTNPEDVEAAAKRIVENRLGLMTAAAQGTPVPNPSVPVLPTPSTAPAPTAA